MKAIVSTAILAGILTIISGCRENKGQAAAGKAENTLIRIEGSIRGEDEAHLQEIVRIFNEKTGYRAEYAGSPDFEMQIQVEAQAHTPPDIAVIPQPGTLHRFAQGGYLQPLDEELVAAIDENYAPLWKELGSHQGKVYGVFHRANVKSFVWYNKQAWEKHGYTVPRTWKELTALQEQMVADGEVPWAVGFASGAATGWPGTDWLENIMLRISGPDMYDQWVEHRIPFNAPAVLQALTTCGEILLNDKYVFGGVGNIIATSFPDSVQALFTAPPQAMMHLQGNFIISSMQQEVREHLEERVGIFPLPAIDPRWGAPLLVGGEQYIAFSDKPGVKEFLLFLTTWEACAPWAHDGGALFPHKNQDFADYGNSIDRELAEALVNTSILRFDGSDLMPTEVGSGSFWTGMVNYVTGAESAAQSLRTIEESWPQ